MYPSLGRQLVHNCSRGIVWILGDCPDSAVSLRKGPCLFSTHFDLVDLHGHLVDLLVSLLVNLLVHHHPQSSKPSGLDFGERPRQGGVSGRCLLLLALLHQHCPRDISLLVMINKFYSLSRSIKLNMGGVLGGGGILKWHQYLTLIAFNLSICLSPTNIEAEDKPIHQH